MISIKSEIAKCDKGVATVYVNSEFKGKNSELVAELEAIINHLEKGHGEMFMACIESRIERMAEE